MVRGSLDEIRAGFYGTCQSAADLDPSDTEFVDTGDPAPGEMFGYLIVGVGSDGKPGLGGLDWQGRQRDLRAKDCL